MQQIDLLRLFVKVAALREFLEHLPNVLVQAGRSRRPSGRRE
jgi:hypothetical protein